MRPEVIAIPPAKLLFPLTIVRINEQLFRNVSPANRAPPRKMYLFTPHSAPRLQLKAPTSNKSCPTAAKLLSRACASAICTYPTTLYYWLRILRPTTTKEEVIFTHSVPVFWSWKVISGGGANYHEIQKDTVSGKQMSAQQAQAPPPLPPHRETT